jgi:hypothetical protein
MVNTFLLTKNGNVLLNLLEISAPSKPDGPKLHLYDATIPANVNQHMQVFGRSGDTMIDRDVELVGKICKGEKSRSRMTSTRNIPIEGIG